MHALGRSPAPMGELLFRITGAEKSHTIGILASHPLTEDRRELMRHEDRPATGLEILSDDEWQALKTICRPANARYASPFLALACSVASALTKRCSASTRQPYRHMTIPLQQQA